MGICLIFPFCIQGLILFVDEFYFHRQRDLPLWERIGHPLDALSVFICALFIFLMPATTANIEIYIGLCAFSCLFITKDEFIHTQSCTAGENWLHALLFILHPVSFVAAGFIWWENISPIFLALQPLLLFILMIFQILYWSLRDLKKSEINNQIYENYGDRWYEADDDPVALLRAESKTKTPWVLRTVKEQGLLHSTTHVLDVGCGAGFLSNELARAGLHVTGVDLSQESLKVAAQYDSTKSVVYLKADAFHLPFENDSFDVLTAMDFLEHVEQPREVIQEFSRVLKPNGIFIFHTFNRNPLAYIVIIKAVEWFVRNTPKDMHVLRLFIKPKELKQYCMDAQLVPQKMLGIKVVFSSIPLKNLLTGFVPKDLKFELTKSLLLSYLGFAVKNSK